MAFDGIVIANLVRDLNDKIVSGRISKIAQPEKDELLFTIKGNRENVRLLVSANASLPLLYFTANNKPSPMTAPNFCMLLRKHIANGRIISVTQPGLERIVRIEVEHLDEMGDLRRKFIVIELMGKHSNIIFCDENNVILDSIKHISAQVSSVREVLPGRDYFIPHSGEKKNPLTITETEFKELLHSTPQDLSKALYMDLTGLSPVVAAEICHLASLDGDISAKEFSVTVRMGSGFFGVNSHTAAVTSFGMSTSTGPLRPLWAMRNAARMVSARSSTRRTVKLCLVMGIVMPSM